MLPQSQLHLRNRKRHSKLDGGYRESSKARSQEPGSAQSQVATGSTAICECTVVSATSGFAKDFTTSKRPALIRSHTESAVTNYCCLATSPVRLCHLFLAPGQIVFSGGSRAVVSTSS